MGGVAGGAGAAFDMVEGAGAFGGCSFTPQTTVLMADGSRKPISKLRVGGLVEAYDPATGKTGPHRVTAVMVNRDPATEHLVTSAGSIETTPNHPFYTTDGGWIPAGQLRIGEHVRTATDTDAVVVSFTVDPHPARMWDITVAGAHSFFVGSGEVLVHNCGPEILDPEGRLQPPDGHVWTQHMVGDPAEKSLFNPGTDLEDLMQCAQASCPMDSGGLQFRFTNAGRPIGRLAGSGSPTNWYTVVTNPAGMLKSMYPGFPKWLLTGN